MVNICSGKCDTAKYCVNDMFNKFTQVLTDIAEPLFGKSYNVARSTTSSFSKRSDECENLRDVFLLIRINTCKMRQMNVGKYDKIKVFIYEMCL